MAGVSLRGRRLATELRRLRARAGLTIEQSAAGAEISKSQLSRIENAESNPQIPVLKALLTIYQVGPAEVESLLQLARDARRREWWQLYSNIANQQLVNYVAFESAASRIRNFEISVLPGLFQTREYAAALLRGLGELPGVHASRAGVSQAAHIDKLVELRMARQGRLDELDYWAILDETALRRQVCPPREMAEQLRHIVELSERPNITVQVLPLEVPVHVGLDGSFTIFSFDDAKDPDVIYSESSLGQFFLDEEGATRRQGSIFDHLRATAMDITSSRERLVTIAQDMETKQ
jgi:transcriptional regulator with XRE-family HTH domain